MKICILGIDHEIQIFDGKRTPEEKTKFEELLRSLVSEHHVEFIGEETYPEKNAIAKSVAISLGVRWAPIEMSQNARVELGIAEEQLHERQELIIGDDGLPMGFKSRRVLSDRIREAYMFWRTLTKADEAQSILVLCGFLHADELRQLFEKEGHQVVLDSLCNYLWYSHPDC